MSKTIVLSVNNVKRHVGRLVGVIDEEECRAIINTEDAAKKIYTSASIPLEALLYCHQKRFVMTTSDRKIFISPTVRFSAHGAGERTFTCDDENEYTLKEEG